MNELTVENIQKYKSSYWRNKEKLRLTDRFRMESISNIAFNEEKAKSQEFSFSIDIPTMKAVSQGYTGRCWLFAGLNLLREIATQKMDKDSLPEEDFQFSQAYLSFWDKIEKANYFLEMVIRDRNKPYDHRSVHSCFQYAITDGGFWTYFTDLVRKYGLVPTEAMPETAQSANTEVMNNYLNYYICKVSADIRNASAAGKDLEALYAMKEQAMDIIFSFLCQCYSCPPDTFLYSYTGSAGEKRTANYTAHSFRDELIGNFMDGLSSVISLPYEKLPFGRMCVLSDVFQVIGMQEEKFLNLPMEELKSYCARQLEEGVPIFCVADDDKMCQEELQLWDDSCFDYETITGFSFEMSRKDYFQLKAGTACHSMLITGVNIGEDGKPDRWKIENTYDVDGLHGGYFICSDSWFDKYMVSVVLDKKYLQQYETGINDEVGEFQIWEII
uniref:aminopeptidase C n=1 Tax=Acetatifactor sp. TaxID=1872090 RepID=UPI00405693F5